MADSRSWSWQVPAYEPRIASDEDNDDETEGNGFATLHVSVATKGRRLSLPARIGGGTSPFEAQKQLEAKVSKLGEALQAARDEFLELRQEASDLQEYSSAKLRRVTRYLGVLAEKTRKFDQITFDYESRLSLLRKEKGLHFNDLISAKGNVRIILRARPKLNGEVVSCVTFPEEDSILINENARGGSVEFRFNQVCGPQVSQGELFQEIQPLVQSVIDGYNVSIFACGPKGTGKTYTLEGPNHDRGMYFRTFEELFDLANGESTPASKFHFYVTVVELCGEEVEDLLKDVLTDSPRSASVIEMDGFGPVVQHKVENPSDFARVFKAGLQNQHLKGLRAKELSSPYLVVTFHVHYDNTSTKEKHYSKISLVDVPGDALVPNREGISESFSSLVSFISSIVSNTASVESSRCTQILSDSIGGESKTLIVLHISPSDSALEETKCWLKAAKPCSDSSRTLTLQSRIYEERNKELKVLVEKLEKSLNETENQLREKGSHESSKFERDQIAQLKIQVAQYAKTDREQKAELASRASKILALEDKLQQLVESLPSGKREVPVSSGPEGPEGPEQIEEEISKRDELIQRLHQENEKLFQRLTARSTFSPKMSRPEPPAIEDFNLSGSGSFKRKSSKRSPSPNKRTSGSDPGISTALQKAGLERSKTTPAGEYLTAALTDFDPEEYNGSAAVSDAANKLLMLVLAAVIKAGATREHDMLEEIRGAVFSFIRKLEPRKVMDTMLVSRVRILYVRSLLAKSAELQAFKVPPVDRFLEKAGAKGSRSSSNGSSPTRSPVSSQLHPNTTRKDIIEGEHIQPFRINLKQEKTSKLSSIVLKLRGIDQETWKQHLTGAKLRELNEEARNFAVGNKRLASLFVHTPAGDLQRQIRTWLAENFDFLSLSSGENASGAVGQLELLSTAIMDGWMAGLGIPTRPSTDSLGQLLSDYTKHVYMSQLQNLKDIAGTLATEEADDLAQVSKIRSALESIDAKRRRVLQQMRTDVALLTKEEGGSPLRCPSTASEEARIASLISLEDIINQAEEIRKEAPQKATFASKKKFMLSRLTALSEQTTALLSIDHACANKFIKGTREVIESASEQQHLPITRNKSSETSGEWNDAIHNVPATEVVQWSVLQFNNGADAPFIIKCGANSRMQLVIKAQPNTRMSKDDGSSSTSNKEAMAVVPSPSALAGLSLEEIKQALAPLPEAFRQLAMARTADGTRARYSRLFKTLAIRVPSLRSTVSDAGEQYDSAGAGTTGVKPQPSRLTSHARRASDSDHFSSDYY